MLSTKSMKTKLLNYLASNAFYNIIGGLMLYR